jgi:hypothetical protein
MGAPSVLWGDLSDDDIAYLKKTVSFELLIELSNMPTKCQEKMLFQLLILEKNYDDSFQDMVIDRPWTKITSFEVN